ncbi:MAG TPA: hypothetical protein VFN18_06275 [Solirubrobacterales bacterium]|nr:hypothetical protein [Solirubrobacterales bacterium]
MVISKRLITQLQPIAADVLGFDAAAIAHLKQRQGDYAGYDYQPGASALAMERRAFVATEMRKLIEAKLEWPMNQKSLPCGGYEWLPDGWSIRLSKTTPESRREDTLALLGIQEELLPPSVSPTPDDEREIVLIRLRGNPLLRPKVDVLSLSSDGVHGTAVPLSAIAAANIDRLPSSGKPAKTTVTLPGDQRSTETG